MKRFSAFLLLACSVVCVAQTAQLKSGSTVYIEPMGGYETYLAAAIVTQHVPLLVVTNRDKAAYIIRSTVTRPEPSHAAIVVNNANGNSARSGTRTPFGASLDDVISTSIAVVDPESSAVVFAYTADRGGLEGTAKDCAKHLRAFIEKKPKK